MLNRFYSGTAFDDSQFTKAEGAKERERKRDMKSIAMQTMIFRRLRRPLTSTISLPPAAFTCPCMCVCVLGSMILNISPYFELYSPQYISLHLYLFVLFHFGFFCFDILHSYL